jgi:L-lactate dehydrogenase complex protein LldF
MTGDGGRSAIAAPFPESARAALANDQLRGNIRHATSSIRARRAEVVAEVSDWEELREAGRALKDAALARLDEVLVELEASVTRAGGVVHWALDGD